MPAPNDQLDTLVPSSCSVIRVESGFIACSFRSFTAIPISPVLGSDTSTGYILLAEVISRALQLFPDLLVLQTTPIASDESRRKACARSKPVGSPI